MISNASRPDHNRCSPRMFAPCHARPLSRALSDIASWAREAWSQPQTFPSSDHGSISATAGGHRLEHQSDPQAQVEN